MASTSTSTSTSTTSAAVATATTATATASTGDTHLHLSANFAHNPQAKSPPIGYDHEVYLQLLAGREGTVQKTPNQIYREERARRRTTRALDPAILDPQGDPSPVDFECAENQGVKERLRG